MICWNIPLRLMWMRSTIKTGWWRYQCLNQSMQLLKRVFHGSHESHGMAGQAFECEWITLCPIWRCPWAKTSTLPPFFFCGDSKKPSCWLNQETISTNEGNSISAAETYTKQIQQKAIKQRASIFQTSLISWFRLHNSVMSPEFLLNSLFHSVPVKGDYKLSKKNEILVDLFLSTLFHTVPPRSPLPPFQPFLPTKFASSFLFFKFCLFLFFFYFSLSAHRFSQSRGQVRGHLARPHRWAWATWQQRSPLLGICCPVPNFHLHPPPLAPTVKKTPAGMLQWRAVSTRGPCGSKVWMLSRGESHWELISEKKVGNKGGWRTSALARGQRCSQEAKRATFCAVEIFLPPSPDEEPR